MPSSLALLICTAFILWLLRREVKNNAGVSPAVWISVAWMAIIGSRFVSEWFNVGPGLESPDAFVEGSPLDKMVFLTLILLGIWVLVKRGVSWRVFVENNLWITAFFVYAAVSILWSEFPVTAFKRWYKVSGHVIMVLVVLSEQEPVKAIRTLFKRCAYILIPLSVVLIKYYPDWGRQYSFWTGEAYNTGVTTNKNMLGSLCFLAGLFFVSTLFGRTSERGREEKVDRLIAVVILLMTGWLLHIADSVNSLICLLFGSLVLLLMRMGIIYRHFTRFIIIASLLFCFFELTLNVRENLIMTFGRDLTLTGRTELWQELQQIKINPLIGVGFESFWLGSRAAHLWDIYWWKPNQAHNGYLETYLNLGLIGVFLQCGMMLSCYQKMRKRMCDAAAGQRYSDQTLVQFGMAFVIALMIYNFAEATFKAVHLCFFGFFLVAVQYPLIQESESRARSNWEAAEPLDRSMRLPMQGSAI